MTFSKELFNLSSCKNNPNFIYIKDINHKESELVLCGVNFYIARATLLWPPRSSITFNGFMFWNYNNWRENWGSQLFFIRCRIFKLYIIQTQYPQKFYMHHYIFRKFLASELKAIEGKVINLQDKNFETGSDMQIGHIFHILVIISPHFITNTQFKYV